MNEGHMTEPNLSVAETEEGTEAVEAPKKRAKPVATTQKYIVINGAIAPNGGGPEDHFLPGSVVELTTEHAKHYNALGYLKPYIED
jgi:hypothetical protein